MVSRVYKIEFLPSALDDLVSATDYIAQTLGNPTAAERLISKLQETLTSIEEFPFSNPAYYPIRPLQREYRKTFIENYLLLYSVDEKARIVTVARFIYAKRNYDKFIN